MSEDKTPKNTLTDEDMVTSPKLSRRLLLAGAGAALVTAAVGSLPAFAGDKEETDKGDAEKDADKSDEEKDTEEGDSEKDEAGKGDAEEEEEHDSD